MSQEDRFSGCPGGSQAGSGHKEKPAGPGRLSGPAPRAHSREDLKSKCPARFRSPVPFLLFLFGSVLALSVGAGGSASPRRSMI